MNTPDTAPHVLALIQYLQTLPIQEPPSPWEQTATFAVGGLLAVGYNDNTDILLVISTQGRGIFDCMRGEKIARDYTEPYPFFDEITLRAEGFGPLQNQTLYIAGLYGGGLPNTTRDGWHLYAIPLPWPHHSIILEHPFRSIYQDRTSAVRVGADSPCELRAYGFSPTGNTFIIATSCELTIFARRA